MGTIRTETIAGIDDLLTELHARIDTLITLRLRYMQNNSSIDALSLSVRLLNCLKRNNITTVVDAEIALGRDGYLLGLRGFGGNMYKELTDKLLEYNQGIGNDS